MPSRAVPFGGVGGLVQVPRLVLQPPAGGDLVKVGAEGAQESFRPALTCAEGAGAPLGSAKAASEKDFPSP